MLEPMTNGYELRVRLFREAKAPDDRVELMHQANPPIIRPS